MTTRDPSSLVGDDTPDFAPDFAERVLRTVDRRRRRRALGLSLAAAVGVLVLPRAHVPGGVPAHHQPAATLQAEDFAWLEEAGTEPSTPSGLLFPDQAESTASTATTSDDNLLVAVAENI